MNKRILTDGSRDMVIFEKKKRLDAAETIISNLIFLRKSLTLYPREHPRIMAGTNNLMLSLHKFFLKDISISFNIYEQDIFFENELLESEHIALQELIGDCLEREIDSFTISKGIKGLELISFLQLTNKNIEDLQNNGGIIKELRRYDIAHILVSKLRICSNSSAHSRLASNNSRSKAMNIRIFDQALVKLNNIFKSVPANEDLDLNETEKLVHALIEGMLDDNNILAALTSLKNYNNYTCRHSINVTILSLLLATKLGLTKKELLTIGTGALLHDIGKLKIPIAIIEKKGSLTSAEWVLVKSHPIKGFDLTCDLSNVDELVPIIAYEHHIGYDLSGYPQTKRIKSIHFFSRIVQIADAYDGATAHRSYHDSASPGVVLASMHKKSGSLFDPNLLRSFISIIGLYPIGSLVMISNGAIGIVIENNTKDILRPKVKIIIDQNGTKINNYLLDLTDVRQQNKVSIAGFADADKYNIDMRDCLLKNL